MKEGNAKEKTVVFEAAIGAPGFPVDVSIPIALPFTQDSTELAHRVIEHHNLPIHLHEGTINISANPIILI